MPLLLVPFIFSWSPSLSYFPCLLPFHICLVICHSQGQICFYHVIVYLYFCLHLCLSVCLHSHVIVCLPPSVCLSGQGGASPSAVAAAMIDAVVDFVKKKKGQYVRSVKILIFQTAMMTEFHKSMKRRVGEGVEEKGFFTRFKGQ